MIRHRIEKDFESIDDTIAVFQKIFERIESNGLLIQMIGSKQMENLFHNDLDEFSFTIKRFESFLRPIILEVYVEPSYNLSYVAAKSWLLYDRIEIAIIKRIDLLLWHDLSRPIHPSDSLSSQNHRKLNPVEFSMICSKGEYDEDFYYEF